MQKESCSMRYPVFPTGHPSKYWPNLTLLNFSDRTRTGALSVVWTHTKIRLRAFSSLSYMSHFLIQFLHIYSNIMFVISFLNVDLTSNKKVTKDIFKKSSEKLLQKFGQKGTFICYFQVVTPTITDQTYRCLTLLIGWDHLLNA